MSRAEAYAEAARRLAARERVWSCLTVCACGGRGLCRGCRIYQRLRARRELCRRRAEGAEVTGLIEFRPGVFARVGETRRSGPYGFTWTFTGEKWTHVCGGSGRMPPPELRTMPVAPKATGPTRLGHGWDWEDGAS